MLLLLDLFVWFHGGCWSTSVEEVLVHVLFASTSALGFIGGIVSGSGVLPVARKSPNDHLCMTWKKTWWLGIAYDVKGFSVLWCLRMLEEEVMCDVMFRRVWQGWDMSWWVQDDTRGRTTGYLYFAWWGLLRSRSVSETMAWSLKLAPGSSFESIEGAEDHLVVDTPAV